MNTISEQETEQDFEALYLAYRVKYETLKHEAEFYRAMYLQLLDKLEKGNGHGR